MQKVGNQAQKAKLSHEKELEKYTKTDGADYRKCQILCRREGKRT